MSKLSHSLFIAAGLAFSVCALANKGAAYNHRQTPTDNLDWSKGWYVGAGVNGNAESTMNLHGVPEVFNHTLSGLDEVKQNSSNAGFDLYIGREISKHWAVELGYTYLGEITFDGEVSQVNTTEIKVNEWNVHAVGLGKLPIGEYFNVFAKGGLAYFGAKQEFKTLSTGDKMTDKVNTVALTYGAGLEATWNQWGVRGEYNVIWPANNVEDDFYVADIISLNIFYKCN